MRRAALHNLGCKANAYETEKIGEQLAERGFEIVPFAGEAEVYVINTCSVTAIADKKSRQMIRRARRRNPQAIVAAVGCFVEGTELDLAELGCDIALGNRDKSRIVDRIEALLAQRDTADREEEPSCDSAAPGWLSGRTRGLVKIQDGCDRFCSYCIIPYLRGRSRSRPVEEIVSEVRRLCDMGVQEIVLTGIHNSSYQDGNEDLLGLCRAIDGRTEVRRLRLGSLEPHNITRESAKGFAELASLCPHFHLSLQSGSDAVLARMNRRYTTEEFAEGVALLREAFDEPGITTDVIAGFPGETEEEFEEGMAFMRRMRFSDMHVFPYSRRLGTRADAMEGQITERVKEECSEKLIALAGEMAADFGRRWEGREVEVLFETKEEIGGRTLWSGFTREYLRAFMESGEDL
ncbi:MAG: tRNA (N(6)-L-threonylcarbamoyladenosine(37)-C(2))-methylthiotransferase MtaB, partial [Lachnospiraceae bacterium]|nr:tRNA (N(6)-L-threonylcarbamoyladenosine(37)-C(2))-methylthiotransferase MtaB [Lachnospiraceae bacterium]